MVKNMSTTNSGFFSFYNFNGTLFFAGDDRTNGQELWKSDGTAAGTILVKDIYPGYSVFAADFYGSLPEFLCEFNGVLYFSANENVHGRELWKSDGTEAGTVMVKDINPGYSDGFPTQLANANSTQLYFVAHNENYGDHIWKSDGTVENTIMVSDLGGVDSGANPSNLNYLNGYLYFFATGLDPLGRTLFRTDGTPEGTMGYKMVSATLSTNISHLTVVNNKLFFTIYDDTKGQELWVLETTTLSTDENSVNLNNFTIYPNPAKDILTIKNPSNQTISSITVMDMMGKIIFKAE